MNQPKDKTREEINAILRIFFFFINKELRLHLLDEKRKLENIIALRELRARDAREATRAIYEAKAGGETRHTRLIKANEQR